MNTSSVEDGEIEEEIQQALDALSLGGDEDEDAEEPLHDTELRQDGTAGDLELTDGVPACLNDFILRVQSRAEGIQEELSECDALLARVADVDGDRREEYFCQSEELKEFAFEIGEDPEELRDRVIRELEVDDCKDHEPPEGPGIEVVSLEGPLFEGIQGEDDDDSSAKTEESAGKDSETATQQAKVEVIKGLEESAKRTVREFEDWFDSNLRRFGEGYDEGQRAAARREQLARKRRDDRVKRNNEEQQRGAQQRMVDQAVWQEELERRELETEKLLSQHQSEIEDMDARTKREKLAFLQERLKYQKTLTVRMAISATKIQAVYRSYRARKPYREKVKQMRELARKKLGDKRQMEIAAERRALEQQRKKDRLKRQRKEEDERKRQEEERLRREASEREERERARQRALEQKRQRERLETEESERLKRKEERRQREQRETEEKANAILEKIAQERRHEEEMGMNIHEVRDVNNHGVEKGPGGKTDHAEHGAGDTLIAGVTGSEGSAEEELAGRSLKGNEEVSVANDTYINEDMNIHDAVDNRMMSEEEAQASSSEMIIADGALNLSAGKGAEDTNSSEGVNDINEDMNIHLHSNGIDSDINSSHPHVAEIVAAAAAEIRTTGNDDSKTGIQPAVKVTIVTDEVLNINQGNWRLNMHRTDVAKMTEGKAQYPHVGMHEGTTAKTVGTRSRCHNESSVDLSDDRLGETTDQSCSSPTEYSSGNASEVDGSNRNIGRPLGQDNKNVSNDNVNDVSQVRMGNSTEGGRETGNDLERSNNGRELSDGSSPSRDVCKLSKELSTPETELTMATIEKGNKGELADVDIKGSNDMSDRSVPIGKTTGASTDQAQLPDVYERARIGWMETSVSFSKILIQAKDCLRTQEKRKRRHLRRPSAIKKMVPVTEEKLLEASPAAKTLAEVTFLKLSDLSDCTLSTLAGCPRLRALSCRQSQLHCLEGFERSPDISYIDVKKNQISFINCRDLSRLVYLDLSENSLSTIHGLEGCTSLKWLNLSRNKITRLGGIESLIALSHLDLSHNQLINTQGLAPLVHLTSLDLSGNHLSSVPGLASCPLLRRVDLSGNSITKPPELINHVLLSELLLDNNSLVTMETMKTAWLPQLLVLSLAQNSLSAVPVLEFAPSLKKLDLRNNYITDIVCLEDGLSKLPYLDELHIDGNPVTEERECRGEILRLIPGLSCLDQESLSPKVDPRPLSQFEVMYQSQVDATSALQERCQTVLRGIKDDISSLENVSDIWTRFLEQSQKMAIDHRYMHEYGDLSPVLFDTEDMSRVIPDITGGVCDRRSDICSESDRSNIAGTLIYSAADQAIAGSRVAIEGSANNLPNDEQLTSSTDSLRSRRFGEDSESHDRRDRTGNSFAKSDQGVVSSSNKLEGAVRKHISYKSCHSDEIMIKQSSSNPRSVGVDVNVSLHGGKSREIQHDSRRGTTSPLAGDPQRKAAIKIQSTWRGFQVRRDIALHTRRYLAAVAIQAMWRGHVVRRRYQRARAALQKAESDDGDDFGDDADLEFLEFNEEALDKEWFPPENPDISPSHLPVLPSTRRRPSPPSHRPVSSVAFSSTRSPPQRYMPHPPKQAWKGTPHDTLTGKPPLPPVTPSTGRGESSVGSTARSARSKKEQQLSEEWGFKDNVTAELMMKRARKMNRSNRKKSLDPIQKLRVLKKAQESNTAPVTQRRRVVERKEYFKAKGETKETNVRDVNERTYQWVHSQPSPGGQPAPPSDPYHGIKGRHSSSEPNLPRMSPDVLQGRVQLMASPSLELESVDGLSVHGGPARGRSNSLTSAEGSRNQLPAVKTNSAPTDRIRQRQAARTFNIR